MLRERKNAQKHTHDDIQIHSKSLVVTDAGFLVILGERGRDTAFFRTRGSWQTHVQTCLQQHTSELCTDCRQVTPQVRSVILSGPRDPPPLKAAPTDQPLGDSW